MTAVTLASVTWTTVLWSLLGECGFILALFIGSRLVPGPIQPGAPREDGTSIRYRMNGLALFLLTLLAAAAAEAAGLPLAVLAHHVWSLLIAANLIAFPASALLVLAARPAPGGTRGGLRGWFYGVDRDPQLFGVDLKMFSYRPSLIGLALMNLAYASAEHAATGQLGLATILYEAFTLLYVGNYFQFEYGMVFTWDIVEERFGWMLVWGDYVLVPFFYSMPAACVVARATPLPGPAAILLTLAFAAGWWMFRGANEQKHRFKQDKAARIWGRPARALGGRLLVSGFWGIGRKLNYTGELTMYIAWTCLAGFASAVPFILPLFLATLLVHRALRDDRRCRAKYGPLWDEYCRHARFRMVPFA